MRRRLPIVTETVKQQGGKEKDLQINTSVSMRMGWNSMFIHIFIKQRKIAECLFCFRHFTSKGCYIRFLKNPVTCKF